MASGLVCGFSCVVRFAYIVGCRLCDWDSGGRGNPCKCSAVEVVRGADPNIDFRIGVGPVRVDRFIDFGNLIMLFYLSY